MVKHRKLRIAWSVAWGIVAVLLVMLWVRSYWWTDYLQLPTEAVHAVALQSYGASMNLIFFDSSSLGVRLDFALRASTADHDSPWMRKHGMLSGFAMVSTPTSFNIAAPNWFLIILSVALGGLLWLPSSRRFTLRTLLIATTLVAISLGLIMWLTR